jgi:nitroreductase/dihydropteridine reductase
METAEKTHAKGLIEKLNWRYATKKMNGQKIPQEKLNRILEAIRLSASSFGLQPFSVLVIEDPEVRKQLLPAAYGQPQLTDASQILLFCAWDVITPERIDTYINLIASERGIPVESLKGLNDSIKGVVASRTPDALFHWAAKQTYIALGTGLIAAAEEEIDATPMEGFNPDAFDEILKLKDKGLRSVSMLALGYRDADKDPLAAAKKVRRSSKDFFIHI